MSFNSKATRPDSRDTAKLRAEYADKVRQMNESKEPASRASLRDKKNEAFEKMKTQIIAERRENIGGLHKVLTMQGKLKSKEQVAKERDAALAAAAAASKK